MVSQGLFIWSHWIVSLWLCWWSCGPQVNIGHMSFPRRSLVCWSSKKQNCVSLSTAEAEYIVAGSCCAQLLWMKQTLKDYGINLNNVPLFCDNESAIKIANNPVQHSKTKARWNTSSLSHRSCYEERYRYHARQHWRATGRYLHKPLDEKRFSKLRCELNILESSNVLWKGHSS